MNLGFESWNNCAFDLSLLHVNLTQTRSKKWIDLHCNPEPLFCAGNNAFTAWTGPRACRRSLFSELMKGMIGKMSCKGVKYFLSMCVREYMVLKNAHNELHRKLMGTNLEVEIDIGLWCLRSKSMNEGLDWHCCVCLYSDPNTKAEEFVNKRLFTKMLFS